jgi:MFS family permease
LFFSIKKNQQPGNQNFLTFSGDESLIMKAKDSILPVIVVSQFLCTSLWFAGNAVAPELARSFSSGAAGHLTSAVQLGFIAGTLFYSFLTIADRFSPSRVFFLSSLAGALANLILIFAGREQALVLLLRFFTGFFLAGIYPVGMKIASDHYDKGLGKALGFLVGALVAGTALPHLLRSLVSELPWRSIFLITSMLSVTGGTLIFLLVKDGPFRKPAGQPDPAAVFRVFGEKDFRSAALGYFGHMWELYAFWAFVPAMIATYLGDSPGEQPDIATLSFAVIGCGSLSCIASGYISQKFGGKRTASGFLFLSGACCLFSPLAFHLPYSFFITFLVFWGLAVIGDSPVFSSLVAQSALPRLKGTALTTVTCAGFSITILSIELLNILKDLVDNRLIFLFLAIGPAAGLMAIGWPWGKQK